LAIVNVYMSSDRQQRITSIFHSAIEREGTERRAFLDGACANDEELRREVESLIEAHEQAGSLMNAPAYECGAGLIESEHGGSLVGRSLDDASPTQITNFKSLFIEYSCFSRDGGHLALARGSTTRDAVMNTDEK
jgi:hypothetical protein